MTTGETLSDAATAPAPRRTRSGAVLVGPSIRARYLPGVLIGLPLISLLLSPFAGAGLQQWRRTRILDGNRGPLEQILEPAWTQLLVGALLLWGLFALWALAVSYIPHIASMLRCIRQFKVNNSRDRGS